ncbi:hypothetical protein IV102_08185 [bacterium]|nr:hypothetical protein [bacterium]
MQKQFLAWLLLAALSSTAWADRLYVRNKMYHGYLTGSAHDVKSLEVDIQEFSRVLGYSLEEIEGNWVVKVKPGDSTPVLAGHTKKLYVVGKEVAYRHDSERKLVHLSDLAGLLGGRLVRHPEAGTIDFNLIPKAHTGYDPKKCHLIFYGADWAPASKLFKPVVVQVDLREIVPVIYVDCNQPRSANYKNFIGYFNGDKIPYTILLGPKGKVLKTWTGYQDLGPFTTEIQKLTEQE